MGLGRCGHWLGISDTYVGEACVCEKDEFARFVDSRYFDFKFPSHRNLYLQVADSELKDKNQRRVDLRLHLCRVMCTIRAMHEKPELQTSCIKQPNPFEPTRPVQHHELPHHQAVIHPPAPQHRPQRAAICPPPFASSPYHRSLAGPTQGHSRSRRPQDPPITPRRPPPRHTSTRR